MINIFFNSNERSRQRETYKEKFKHPSISSCLFIISRALVFMPKEECESISDKAIRILKFTNSITEDDLLEAIEIDRVDYKHFLRIEYGRCLDERYKDSPDDFYEILLDSYKDYVIQKWKINIELSEPLDQ